MKITKINQVYNHEFKFTQEQVNAYIEFSGDNNPIHWDADFAATTPFGKPIMHGCIGLSIFSKIFGTTFPGEGSIYCAQSAKFMAPMFVETNYIARFTVTEIVKNKAIFKTEVIDQATEKVAIIGEATLINKTEISLVE